MGMGRLSQSAGAVDQTHQSRGYDCRIPSWDHWGEGEAGDRLDKIGCVLA